MNYPVAKARCTSCHDPHGSSKPGILWTNVHYPVANKMCNQCHLDASSPDALKIKRPGFELCRGCHADMVNETFGKNRIHWPLLDKVSCLNCHNPHAARQNALLKETMKTLCNSCHQDTARRQEKSLTKHKPIQEGTARSATLLMPPTTSSCWTTPARSTCAGRVTIGRSTPPTRSVKSS